jgi:hypothetical protein
MANIFYWQFRIELFFRPLFQWRWGWGLPSAKKTGLNSCKFSVSHVSRGKLSVHIETKFDQLSLAFLCTYMILDQLSLPLVMYLHDAHDSTYGPPY